MSGWMDLVAAYLQYEAADKASNKKPKYSISPQQSWLFDKLKDLMNYSPTRDYVSSYADSYLKGMNAPNGSLNWKPTFQSDYMKGQQPLPNMSVDLSKLPIFQGDKNGQMPWNPNYTGAGIGGKPTVPGGSTGSGSKGALQPDGSYGPIMPGYYNPAFTKPGAGTAWGARNDTIDGSDNPSNPGGLPGGTTLPNPPNPADGQATWDAIQNGLAHIGQNGSLIWKATGAVLGYLIMGPMGVPTGIKVGGQVYNWTNKPGQSPPPSAPNNAPKPGGGV